MAMPVRSLLSQMPLALSDPTNLRAQALPTRHFFFSEDADEEDEEEDEEDVDEKEEEEKEKVNQREESDRPPPPVSRDVLLLKYEVLGPSLAGSSEPRLALAADHDVFNPNWTHQDLEYTSLEYGKKTALFVCKSIPFGP